jgi:release factor glutamine methyltransferase
MARLRVSGSESARLDAEVLLAFVLGTERTTLLAHPERDVEHSAAGHYDELVSRRAAGEPVAYIRGLKEFFGLAFASDRRALIPRPETERLVELARVEVMTRLQGSAGRGPVRIIDVGTGGGAVAISLAVELRRRNVVLGRDVMVLATDASMEALELARENAVAHAVADSIEFDQADLLAAGHVSLDVVLANLPYVRSGAIEGLPIAATFEPRIALDGGVDGLDVVRRLLGRLPSTLEPDGVALLEIGADQGSSARAAVEEVLPGWLASVETDLAGLPRILRVVRVGAA